MGMDRLLAPERRVHEEAFDAFFRNEQPQLVALALALCGDHDLARDLAQEALVRAYRAWPSVGTFARPGAWTRRVLINLASDTQRRRRTEVRLLEALRGAVKTEEQPTSDENWNSPFWSAVRALPERQRAAVVLRYVVDLSIAETAAILRVAPGTVKASLWKARTALAPHASAARREGQYG